MFSTGKAALGAAVDELAEEFGGDENEDLEESGDEDN
jgi:hypothetical protein